MVLSGPAFLAHHVSAHNVTLIQRKNECRGQSVVLFVHRKETEKQEQPSLCTENLRDLIYTEKNVKLSHSFHIICRVRLIFQLAGLCSVVQTCLNFGKCFLFQNKLDVKHKKPQRKDYRLSACSAL